MLSLTPMGYTVSSNWQPFVQWKWRWKVKMHGVWRFHDHENNLSNY